MTAAPASAQTYSSPRTSSVDRRESFLLASLIAGYPAESFAEHVSALLEHAPDGLRARLESAIRDPDALDELRSTYIDLFDRGRSANPLYETEYGRDRALVKGSELADLAGFYRAFGLVLDGEGVSREMLDHVAVELEFYALLLIKEASLEYTEGAGSQGVEITRDARKKFLLDHLGRFPAAIAARPGVAADPFYSEVFTWIRALVADECARLEVEPVSASWIAGQSEPEAVCCGGTLGGRPEHRDFQPTT